MFHQSTKMPRVKVINNYAIIPKLIDGRLHDDYNEMATLVWSPYKHKLSDVEIREYLSVSLSIYQNTEEQSLKHLTGCEFKIQKAYERLKTFETNPGFTFTDYGLTVCDKFQNDHTQDVLSDEDEDYILNKEKSLLDAIVDDIGPKLKIVDGDLLKEMLTKKPVIITNTDENNTDYICQENSKRSKTKLVPKQIKVSEENFQVPRTFVKSLISDLERMGPSTRLEHTIYGVKVEREIAFEQSRHQSIKASINAKLEQLNLDSTLYDWYKARKQAMSEEPRWSFYELCLLIGCMEIYGFNCAYEEYSKSLGTKSTEQVAKLFANYKKFFKFIEKTAVDKRYPLVYLFSINKEYREMFIP